MASEIICNKTGREVRVALIENGQLSELQIDRGDNRGFVGNVYLGRVVRVLPGMQAAFVEIGLERAAFLYVGDIYTQILHMHMDDADRPEAKPQHPRNSRSGHPPIQDLLKEGQEIVVQVAKDPIGTKGARLTTHIALPGRFMVLMPTVEHVGISRRIDKDKERRRLREFVERNRHKGAGFIVRTVCQGQPTERLQADMDFLFATWERIQSLAKEQKGPSLLHGEYGVVLRTVRDLMDDHIVRVVLDDRDLFDKVRTFMSDFMPKLKD
ncbi:MAG: ribonuclease G, partial [Kiritimatiellia bacterium]